MMSHFWTSYRIPFCQFLFVSILFQIYIFKKHSVLLSSACFLPSEADTELGTGITHNDRNRGEKLELIAETSNSQRLFLHYLLPRVSCSQSGSLRTSRCGLWMKQTPKHPNLWLVGAYHHRHQLIRKEFSISLCNKSGSTDSRLHNKHELLNFYHKRHLAAQVLRLQSGL